MSLDSLASLSDTLMVVAVIGYVAAAAVHALEVMPGASAPWSVPSPGWS